MKIAFICAFPASSNPGMVSVDLAVESVKSRLDRTAEIDRFCAWRGFEKQGAVPLNYQCYSSVDQLQSYDLIVFWGDFLHWRGYAYKDFLTRGRGKIKDFDDQDLIDHWYQLYLFENQPYLQQRTIVVGGTFYAMSAEDVSDQRYMLALTNLYKNAKLALMRDLASANFVSQLTNNNQSNFGCDCAALLEVDHLLDYDSSVDPLCVSYALGRSGHGIKLKKLVNAVADRLDAIAVDLNWLEKGVGIDRTLHKIAQIKQSRVVITDIYHCAITAWREGIPVICIGQGANRVTSTLSDKKKELLHMQLFSMQNYIYFEEILKESTKSMSLHCVNIIQDTENNNIGSATIAQQKHQVLQKLLAVINS
jgi:polysaccharide pyruvyl transferase WcaK-like protein